jgi:hypothetical protein
MMTRALTLFVAILVTTLSAGGGAQTPSPSPDTLPRAEGRERNLRAYVELLRRDIRVQKVALITQLMEFTDAEDAAFWPIYREYEIEQSRIYDTRLRVIEMYAETFSKLTDAQADDLVGRWLDLESRRTAMRRKYYEALKAKLTPRVAARALQIEHQLDLLVDLQVAAELPVVATK